MIANDGYGEGRAWGGARRRRGAFSDAMQRTRVSLTDRDKEAAGAVGAREERRAIGGPREQLEPGVVAEEDELRHRDGGTENKADESRARERERERREVGDGFSILVGDGGGIHLRRSVYKYRRKTY